MEELSDDFIKLVQMGLLVVGVLSIFFIFISYNFNVLSNDAEREAYTLGDALLSDVNLAYMGNGIPVKALFLESKLNAVEADSTVIKYPNGKIDIVLLECSGNPNCDWSIVIGPSSKGAQAFFYVAIRMNSGNIKMASMTVNI
jgi:hypothetical protein